VNTAGGTVTVNGISFSGPSYQAAVKTCRPAGGSSMPPVSEHERRMLLDFAKCMRTHGFPRWTDPTFPAGGGIDGSANPYDKTTPGIMHSAEICNGIALHQRS
jgi:hypothetical protein